MQGRLAIAAGEVAIRHKYKYEEGERTPDISVVKKPGIQNQSQASLYVWISILQE
jgi:hypothetical protein